MENCRIYYGFKVQWKMLFLMLLTTIATFANIYRDWQSKEQHYISLPIMVVCCSLVSGLLFYNIFKIFDKRKVGKVAIELSEEGITDNHRKVFIKWNDIYNLVLNAGNIAVILHHAESLQTKSVIGKIRFWYNNRLYGSPLLINTGMLKGEEFDNYNVMYDYMVTIENMKNN